MRARRWAGLVGSVGLHAVLLAWASTRVQPEPLAPAEMVPIEVIELTPPSAGPLAIRAGGSPAAEQRRGPTPRVEPEPTRAPEPAREPSPRARPAKRSVARAAEAVTEPAELGPPEPQPTPASAADTSSAAIGPAQDWGEASLGDANSSSVGDGLPDHSAYGAELARLILRELDRDPVPGLASGDSITLLLRVRADGRLLPVGRGRGKRVGVLGSTLGPLRARAILRRVERASRDFPAHPPEFRRRYYEMDLTVRFRDSASGMARR